LHALVREHLPSFLRYAEEHYTRPLPRYVRRAFEQYLRCGLPEHGFLRLRCDDCGHDRVVAFAQSGGMGSIGAYGNLWRACPPLQSVVGPYKDWDCADFLKSGGKGDVLVTAGLDPNPVSAGACAVAP